MKLKEIVNKYSKAIECLEGKKGYEIYVPEKIANEYLNFVENHLTIRFDDYYNNSFYYFKCKMNDIIAYTGHIGELMDIDNKILNYISELTDIHTEISSTLYSVKSVIDDGNSNYRFVKFQKVLDLDFVYYCIVLQIKIELNNLFMRCKYCNIKKKNVYDKIKDLYENIKYYLYDNIVLKRICNTMPSEFNYRTISKKYKQLSDK